MWPCQQIPTFHPGEKRVPSGLPKCHGHEMFWGGSTDLLMVLPSDTLKNKRPEHQNCRQEKKLYW
jgi:hypothetical protein